jgi:hypothetical protein
VKEKEQVREGARGAVLHYLYSRCLRSIDGVSWGRRENSELVNSLSLENGVTSLETGFSGKFTCGWLSGARWIQSHSEEYKESDDCAIWTPHCHKYQLRDLYRRAQHEIKF